MAYFDNAQKGDKVICLVYDDSTIVEVIKLSTQKDEHFQIYTDKNMYYTLDGKITSESNQVLFYAGTEINIIPAPEPKRELICPLCGEPVHIVSPCKDDKWTNIYCINDNCLKPATGWMQKEKAIAKWLKYSWEATGNER